ncbi:hypothetical protein TUM4438_10420 [Shewanella sairae]|uniref:Conjugal transfer protein n=1 Tax=Shewanella sairae TaxID=190310 RepID=A0ABQ4P6V7_9GAMM|nr:RAQPRD family integrative conjugative element protein [Shewanella sairae]MCL1130476.1 hypothetical protein [Shewanella sairae]GIU42866.1 hypothetical protein TUM4438_10420 [Shewanella sairae]
MRSRFYLVPLLLSLSVSSAQAASVMDEKKELAAISDHLTKLEFLIQRAEQRADYRSPRQLDYQALRSDLRDIQSGIDAYLYPSRPMPLPIKPLSGDYTVQTP